MTHDARPVLWTIRNSACPWNNYRSTCGAKTRLSHPLDARFGESVLLIKRHENGNWEPPGRVLELDESIEDGLRREVREETGVELEIGQLSGAYKNMSRGVVALVFRCRATNEPYPLIPEAEDIAWISFRIFQSKVEEVYAVRIRGALTRGPVLVRSRDGTRVL